MGTAGKVLDLLDILTRLRPQAGLSEIARLSGLNKATYHRLLTEMDARGLVEQTGPAREYRLGPAVLKRAYLREASMPTRDAAMRVLPGLARATDKTAHLWLLVGGRRAGVPAAGQGAAHPVRPDARAGHRRCRHRR